MGRSKKGNTLQCQQCSKFYYSRRASSKYCSKSCYASSRVGKKRNPYNYCNKTSRTTKEQDSLIRRERSFARNEEGLKQCTKCVLWKDEKDFSVNEAAPDKLHTRCKRCSRSWKLEQAYGITADQFDTMLEEQDYKCAICPREWKPGDRSFHVDHDHSCCPGKITCGRCIRGLLCSGCNSFLGKLELWEYLKPYSAYLRERGGEYNLKF